MEVNDIYLISGLTGFFLLYVVSTVIIFIRILRNERLLTESKSWNDMYINKSVRNDIQDIKQMIEVIVSSIDDLEHRK